MKLTAMDHFHLVKQLKGILPPHEVVDVAFDCKRAVAYVAAEAHSVKRDGSLDLLDRDVFAIVAPIYQGDDFDKKIFGYNFVVTSDSMPAEFQGLTCNERYCHCPARILKQLSPPANERAAEWREVCKRNAQRK